MILLLLRSPAGVALVLAVHLLWALWMITGVVLAVAGFHWRRLWTWRTFRIAHLVGLLLTATVPLWNRGVCPLTNWEWTLDAGTSQTGSPAPFLTRLLRSILYIDVPPAAITAVTVLGAALTTWVFIAYPPRRARHPAGE